MVGMSGYKVYYNGEKYVMNEEKTVIDDLKYFWTDSYEHARNVVADFNHHMKQDISELKDDDDFVVRTCKDCGSYYTITFKMVSRYTHKNLKLPVRCPSCIQARRQSRY